MPPLNRQRCRTPVPSYRRGQVNLMLAGVGCFVVVLVDSKYSARGRSNDANRQNAKTMSGSSRRRYSAGADPEKIGVHD